MSPIDPVALDPSQKLSHQLLKLGQGVSTRTIVAIPDLSPTNRTNSLNKNLFGTESNLEIYKAIGEVDPITHLHLLPGGESTFSAQPITTLFLSSKQVPTFLSKLFQLNSLYLSSTIDSQSKYTSTFIQVAVNVDHDGWSGLDQLISLKDLDRFRFIFTKHESELVDNSVLGLALASSTSGTKPTVVIHAFDSRLLNSPAQKEGFWDENQVKKILTLDGSTFEDDSKLTSYLLKQINLISDKSYSSLEFNSVAKTCSKLAIQFNLPLNVESEVDAISIRIYKPLDQEELASLISSKRYEKVIINELSSKASNFSSLHQDIISSIYTSNNFNGTLPEIDLVYQPQYNRANLDIENTTNHIDTIPYVKALSQVLKDRLVIANQIGTPTVWHDAQSHNQSPDFGYGVLLATLKKRTQLVELITQLVLSIDISLSPAVKASLSNWLVYREDVQLSAKYGDEIQRLLSVEVGTIKNNKKLEEVYQASHLLKKQSYWLVGSDQWCYDLGNSGVHQVLASGENINILIIDTTAASEQTQTTNGVRKKDLGLYAMTYGSAYVASSSIYSSYSQTIQAIHEADSFKGPSVVLGYLPLPDASSPKDSLTSVKLIQDSKKAVDAGIWPLYRWDPSSSTPTGSSFSLDSSAIKKELKDFLDRDNFLSVLATKNPQYSIDLNRSKQSNLTNQINSKSREAKDAIQKLLSGLSGPPLLILFGSDGGNAEALAKKLERAAKMRGYAAKRCPANELEISELESESLVLFVVSAAGQGEFPVNAKSFWKGLSGSKTELSNLQFGVFGLGDSHYWPREEDKHYYNKPAKDLHAKLLSLGAKAAIGLGLGDDQDADGYLTGYQAWEPELWTGLQAELVEGAAELFGEEVKITDDQNKVNSNFLRGTIAEGLEDRTTGALAESDTKLTKFHGIYQQDDRDIREQRLSNNLEPAFSFMVRVRVPGGVATPSQYLQMDKVANEYTGGSLKLTTRQAFQFHGVLKWNLKNTIRGVNKVLMDTLAACGDVNRNVMLTVNPDSSDIHQQVHQFSLDLSAHLSPQTSAYHEIWLADKLVVGNALSDHEPLYGPTYLPRKFKIAIAVPPSNDVDVFAHCLGFIAVIEKINGKDKLIGFNVTAGGGMGMTHNNTKTFPRLADVMGFCTPSQAILVAEKVMLVQRDFGDRTNRKHARLKYTIDDRGIDWFRKEVESRLGYTLEPPRPYTFDENGDKYGWYQKPGGNWECGLFMQNGRIRDEPGMPWMTGLRKAAELMESKGGKFILTPNQNLVLSNIPATLKDDLQSILKEHNLYQTPNFTQLRLHSMACVALPTCALAMAESERYLPTLVDKLDVLINEAGLESDAITLRMTGCPNGCARPYVAEIAFVGKAPGTYNLYLGGGFKGERLNKLYKENVDEPAILEALRPLFKQYALERLNDERFGDFVIRAGVIKATTAGSNFHD